MESESRVWQPRGRFDSDLEEGGAPRRRQLSSDTADTLSKSDTQLHPTVDELAYVLERLSHWDHRDAARWLLHVRTTNRKRAAAKELIDLLEEAGLRSAVEELEAQR